ncbi:uncharacterized protein METZ01_LOCUS121406 [marine metagenome]|uniref:Macro domain-containing protein n=1 Tax=marine metagenome TaxID=408172 RepID=A0A381XVP5_9ZZZZ
MIEVVTVDITTLDVSAVVNAANSTLLGGAGVDGAIHRAAGPGLRAHCRTLGGCPVGQVRMTPGFGLRAPWIIHTVGPVWQGGSQGEADLLQACYTNSFELAVAKGLDSIAFPAISTGAYGYPVEQAAVLALETMQLYRLKVPRILVCCFSDRDARVYGKLLSDSTA